MKKKYNGVIEIIAMNLKQEGFIQASDIAIVKYSIDYLCQSLIYHIILIFIGILTCHYLFSLIYILVMGCLKHFTGGAHAPNATLCSLLSYSIFLATLCLTDRIHLDSDEVVYTMLTINALVTLFLAPVGCRNKHFSADQRHRLKLISAIIITIIGAATCHFHVEGYNYVTSILLFCLTINSINLMIGFIISKKETIHEPKCCNL